MSAVRLAHVWSEGAGVPAALPLCAPLQARGWDISHFAPPGARSERSAGAGEQRGGASGARAGGHRMSSPRSTWADVRAVFESSGAFLSERFDIVHMHHTTADLFGRALAAAARAPIVVRSLERLSYGQDTPPARRALCAIRERVASLRTSVVLTQSAEDRLTLLRGRVLSPERIVLLGTGVDLRRFNPVALGGVRRDMRAELGFRAGEVVFLAAARRLRNEGLLELFEAVRLARGQDARVRLAVAGEVDGASAGALDHATMQLARESGVVFLGPRADMPWVYAASDAVVLASHEEGPPRVLMEGAAMGRALLATDVRGCREVVRPPRNGFLVQPHNPAALAVAMLTLARYPELRARFGAENALEARQRFDVQRVVTRIIDVYDRLLQRRGKGVA